MKGLYGQLARQLVAGLCGTLLLTVSAYGEGSPAAWFGGGSFDGFDNVRVDGAPDYPRVHNASGADNITPVSARLHGMLVATGGAPARVYVLWGYNDGGTNRDDWTEEHAFGDFGEVQILTPLTCNITVTAGALYYYRFYAINTLGETGWAPETAVFRVSSPPSVSTGAGAGVGITAAALNGALTAANEAAMWLDWGSCEAGEPPVGISTFDLGLRVLEGTAEAPNPFKVTLSTLSAATTYAYRLRAENSYGTAASDWVWFTTRPANFVTTPDLGWFGGGSYDGFDETSALRIMSGFTGGTVLTIR